MANLICHVDEESYLSFRVKGLLMLLKVIYNIIQEILRYIKRKISSRFGRFQKKRKNGWIYPKLI